MLKDNGNSNTEARLAHAMVTAVLSEEPEKPETPPDDEEHNYGSYLRLGNAYYGVEIV